MIKHHYRFNGLAQVRIATYSIESYENIIANGNNRERSLRRYADLPLSKLALRHASPSLYEQLSTDGQSARNSSSFLGGVFKYVNRHANRTIPFGMFVAHRAFVNSFARAETDSSAVPTLSSAWVSIGPPSKMLWVNRNDSAQASSRTIALNPTMSEFESVYNWVRLSNRLEGDTQNMRLKRSPVISEIVSLLKTIRLCQADKLVEHLSEKFSDIESEKALSLLSRLIDIEFLQDIDKSHVSIDGRMRTFNVDILKPTANILNDISVNLRKSQRQSQSTASEILASDSMGAEFLEVCLSPKTEMHLTSQEATALTAAANIIILTSARVPESAQSLERWRFQFIEKFGLGNPVPVVTALNPYLGVGPMFGYINPPPVYTRQDQQEPAWRAVDLDLRVKMLTKLNMRCGVIGVDLAEHYFSADLMRLEQNVKPSSVYPDLDFSVQIGMDNGRKTFLFRSDSVALGGHTFTRSRRTMDSTTRERWYSVLDNLAIDQGVSSSTLLLSEPISAAVDYLIPNDTEISSFTSTEPLSDGVPFEKLVVMATEHDIRVGVVDQAGGFIQHVINHPTLVIPLAFKNEARAVVDISRGAYRVPACFSWAQLENSLFLPEVRYGEIVLRPAEWRVSSDLKDAAAATVKNNEPQILQSALHSLGIIGDLFYASGDNRLHFNTQSTISLLELAHLVRRAESEDRIEKSSLDHMRGLPFVTNGGLSTHSTELIFSVSRRCRSPKHLHIFSGQKKYQQSVADHSWITLTLFTTPDALHRLVKIVGQYSGHLYSQSLIDRWFYLRYNDAGCSIRVRWQANSDGIFPWEEVQKLVAQAQDAALLRGWKLGEYIPESNRYGTGEVLDVCHDAFFVSTNLAIATLRNESNDSDGLELHTALYSLVQYIVVLGIPLDFVQSILSPSSKPTKEARTLWSSSSTDICRAIIDIEQECRVSGNTPFDRLCTPGRNNINVANVILDLLHMHCNRLHSSGDPFEDNMYWLLRRALLKREFIDE